MIIRQVRLHPFAGISDRTIVFTPGMNIVLGPNEAGKSTLVHALRNVLFTPTDCGKRVWKSDLARFVPLGGGDVIRVTLDLEMDGRYRLEKSWGHEKRSALTLPGSQVVTAPKEVQSRVDALLGLRRGTWENVLLAYQSTLANTINDLRQSPDERNELAQLLRQASLATDGVSIEKLGQLIQQRLDTAISKWDSELQRPEGNRGADNPWRRGVGTVLETWYERERIRNEYTKTEQFERKLDELTARINDVVTERDALETYVTHNEPIAEDVRKRQTLELQIDQVRKQTEQFKQISKQWPRVEATLDTQLEAHARDVKAFETLKAELDAAKTLEANRDKRKQLEEAKDANRKLEKARAKLVSMHKITTEQWDELARLDKQRENLEAGLSAGQLQLTFQPKQPIQLNVQKDLESARDQTVGSGDTLSIEAGGRIVLEHPEWSLVVKSGEAGFETLKNQHDETLRALSKLLGDLDVESVEQGRAIHMQYATAEREVEDGQKRLREILKQTTIELLEKELGTEPAPVPARPLGLIAEDYAESKAKCESGGKEIQQLRTELDNWKEQHESWDKLQEALLESLGKQKQLEKQLAELKTLPKEVTDTNAFLAEFAAKKERLKAIKENELPRLKLERAEHERETPERSIRELDEARRNAERRHEQALAEAKALDRVRAVYARLRQQLDSGTLTPWIERMQTIVGPLTAERYQEVDLDTGATKRPDAEPVPFQCLSVGAQACLGLAVRLSMASYFLDGRQGFLLLDDPLVDLDPERQSRTVEVLRHFADTAQVIIFTCHPQHAELFGVDPVHVERVG